MTAFWGFKVFWLVYFIICTWRFGRLSVFWMSTVTTDWLSTISIFEIITMTMVSFKALIFFINLILELAWTIITQFLMTYMIEKDAFCLLLTCRKLWCKMNCDVKCTMRYAPYISYSFLQKNAGYLEPSYKLPNLSLARSWITIIIIIIIIITIIMIMIIMIIMIIVIF